ncbi:DUF4124 domain-containing protein [Arenimonas fontis]|nr:DUF4124 domain-containing protein [Arenimonas fontis]
MAVPEVADAAEPADNAGMRSPAWSSLAVLLLLVGPAGATGEITVWRCTDAGGRVTLQDQPCPAGQAADARQMVRPQDPPPRPPAPQPPPAPAPQPPPEEPYYAWAPPPIYQCTDFDGAVRYSEDYDPNYRCVPLAVLGYDVAGTPAAGACRWVRESCLRLDDEAACAQFKAKLKQARSDALHAFSDTAAYRRSEVERLQRIVNESCR